MQSASLPQRSNPTHLRGQGGGICLYFRHGWRVKLTLTLKNSKFSKDSLRYFKKCEGWVSVLE